MSVVATVSGTLTVVVVLVLAGVARRPACRRVAVAGHPTSRPSAPGRRWLGIALAGVVAASAALVAGPAPVIVVGGGATVLVLRRRRTDAARRRRELEAAMVDAVELFVLCVHAGRSPTQAVADVAARAPPALRDAFGAVELQLHRGRSLADALDELHRLGGTIGHELARAVASADRDGVATRPSPRPAGGRGPCRSPSSG